MALKVKDLKISFNLDEVTWGDVQSLRTGGLLEFCEKYAVIEGVSQKDIGKTLRELSFWDVNQIDQLLSEFIRERNNPTDETGKN